MQSLTRVRGEGCPTGRLITYLPVLDSHAVDRAVTAHSGGPPPFVQIKANRRHRPGERLAFAIPLGEVAAYDCWHCLVLEGGPEAIAHAYLIPGAGLLEYGEHGTLADGRPCLRLTLSPASPTRSRWHVAPARLAACLEARAAVPAAARFEPAAQAAAQTPLPGEGAFFEESVAAALVAAATDLALYRPAVDLGRDLLVQRAGTARFTYLQVKGTAREAWPSIPYSASHSAPAASARSGWFPPPKLASRAPHDPDHITFEAHLAGPDPRWGAHRLAWRPWSRAWPTCWRPKAARAGSPPPGGGFRRRRCSASGRPRRGQRDAELLPGLGHGLRLRAPPSEEPLGRVHDHRRELGKAAVGLHPPPGERAVPDHPRLLPGVPADRGRGQVEGVVEDARVGVHPAVVAPGPRVAVHGRWLMVVLEGGARRLHGAERHAMQCRPQDASADQPVGLRGRLTELVLLDQRSDHVRDRLVEGARLAQVLRLAVYWVTAWVSSWPTTSMALVKPVKRLGVAGTEDHPGAVPEGVVVAAGVVDLAQQAQARPSIESRWKASQ